MATAEPSGHHESGDVSIAFNTGPLAQMGLSIPLDAAYQLAVGAYVSFKAKLRSKSLVEKLQVSGATLVPSTSFNKLRYTSLVSSESWVRGRSTPAAGICNTFSVGKRLTQDVGQQWHFMV